MRRFGNATTAGGPKKHTPLDQVFHFFHGKRHPSDLGEVEVTAFLNHLAVQRNVAAPTQNQALSALLFLYKDVLGKDLPME